jgi:hypothetical protein
LSYFPRQAIPQNIKIIASFLVFVFVECVGIIQLLIWRKNPLEYKKIIEIDKIKNEIYLHDDEVIVNLSDLSEIVVITANALKKSKYEKSACSSPSQQLLFKLENNQVINVCIAKFDTRNAGKLGSKISNFTGTSIKYIRGWT